MRTGTVVYVVAETGDFGGGESTGSWEIVDGFGTGDLAGVTGRGKGAAESAAEGARVKGTIRCG